MIFMHIKVLQALRGKFFKHFMNILVSLIKDRWSFNPAGFGSSIVVEISNFARNFSVNSQKF